jgi:hypothetical protein
MQTILFGAAIGRAASESVTPVLEPVRQHAWEKNQVKVLEPNIAARLAVQGLTSPEDAQSEASRSGISPNRLGALMRLAQVAPSMAEAFSMRRRDKITLDQLHHAYAKDQIEPQYWDALDNLLHSLLTPSEIANAVQQGHLANHGGDPDQGPILPEIGTTSPPAEGAVAPLTPDGHPPSTVPLTQLGIDPVEQAGDSGIDFEQLQVLANLVGLPPGAETVLTMWNRGLIDEDTVNAGIREGHMKTKWLAAFKRMRWAVLSGQEYAEARLRDWVTEEEMYAGGALTGHTKSQMDLFYKNRGRTATPRQVWLAWARKVVGPNYPGEENRTSLTTYEDHELAIRRSNIRPEYAKMLWDIRFNYPPLFQLNRLVEAGAITGDTAALWASYNLEAPDVIEALKKYWSGGAKVKANPWLGKAQQRFWTDAQNAYIKDGQTRDVIEPLMAVFVTDLADRDAIFQWWTDARTVTGSPPPGA